ncbi:MAG TPA: PEP-CTERM sorting domain-containing protein [Bryobacteraceae bacterium]|nr:PEP-CTERM sorting domain-containing protein [Bryobacteraceae bacterium]
MKKIQLLRVSLLFTLLAACLPAATLSIDPVSGIAAGGAGDTVGWGFSVFNTDPLQSISFSQSVLINETNPLLGVYTDFIGPQGGPDNFSVDPNSTWSEGFDLASQSGLGSFQIDPNAVIGSSDSGSIRVFYNLADGTPESVDVPFTVQVQAPSAAPEPETWSLLLVGLGLVLGSRQRRRSA